MRNDRNMAVYCLKIELEWEARTGTTVERERYLIAGSHSPAGGKYS